MEDIEALFARGVAAQQAGRVNEAIEAYRRVLDQDPQRFTALNNLGMVLHAAGRLEEALTCYQRVLAGRDNPRTRTNLGNALRDLGRKEEAVAEYRKALEFNDGDADVHSNLGVILAEQGHMQEALSHLERAVALGPDRAHVHSNLGNARQAQARMEEAAALYRRAVELNPDYAEAHSNLGTALVALGHHEEALEHFRHAARLRPWLGGAQRQLAQLRPQLVDVEEIQRRLDDAQLPSPHRAEMHFALGEVYRARGEHDRAFTHYAEGNRLKRRAVRFDPAAHARAVDGLIDQCTPAFFGERSDFGVDSNRPVFIVGMPRSGTSLVEQILASHSAVHGGGEPPYLPGMVRRIAGGAAGAAACVAVLEGLDGETSRVLAREYLEKVNQLAPDGAAVEHITDKLPDNFLRIALIRLLLPQARIIHCRRDPRDTCLSLYFQSFTGSHPYAWDLADIGAYYRDYQRLMDHWGSVLPPGVMLDVRYEELVADQERVSREMIRFLGLAWDPACLDFHRTERVVTSASNAAVRRPVYGDAVGRWRRYEKHLGPLLEVLGPIP